MNQNKKYKTVFIDNNNQHQQMMNTTASNITFENCTKTTMTTTAAAAAASAANAKKTLNGYEIGTEAAKTKKYKRTFSDSNPRIISCSQSKAFIAVFLFCSTLISCSVFLSFGGTFQNECHCAGQKPIDFIDEDWNMSRTLVPISKSGEIFPWRNIRLPTFLKPIYYNLTIHPNLTTSEVKGQVSIQFTVTEDTKFIVLHSHNLTISEQMIENEQSETIKISRVLEFEIGQQIYIETKDMFERDRRYTLSVRYESKLSNDFRGFYLTHYYDDVSGEKRHLAGTYFQPTYARAAFPCFDEPHLKAKFKMSIFRDRFHISLFNSPVKKTEDVGFYMGTGLLRDDFEETFEMSTYLVAFVICDYNRITRKTSSGVSVSIYTPNSELAKAELALQTAIFMTEYFENLFNYSYPFTKQDLVAIPDLSEKAMENWGLITFRASNLLYDSQETSTMCLQEIVRIIAHQIAHQWFGNLVTMHWWTDLWLNEGFASFLEYRAVERMKPHWRMLDQFVYEQTQPALALDALTSTHSILLDDIFNPSQIISIFDTISYKKGAAILNMLQVLLKGDSLANTMIAFLKRYQFRSSQTDDFWSILNENHNQSFDIKQVMHLWTRNSGYPLVKIRKTKSNLIVASQEHFLLHVTEKEIYDPDYAKTTKTIFKSLRNRSDDGDNDNETANKTNSSENGAGEEMTELQSQQLPKWFIPLTYVTNNDNSRQLLLFDTLETTFNVTPEIKWIKANVNQSGFYRVLYSPDLWLNLISALRSNRNILSVADRANLIDDAFVLNRAGLLDINVTLELLLYLKDEIEYVPWATALKHLKLWSISLYESSTYPLFLKFLNNISTPIAEHLTWNNRNASNHLENLLRSDVLLTRVLIGENKNDIAEAKKRFRERMDENKRIDPDLKEVVYLAGVKFGDSAEWNYCWSRYSARRRAPNVPGTSVAEAADDRRVLLKALASTSDPWLLQRLLLRTLDFDRIHSHDIQLILAVVAENPTGRLLSWRFLKSHWSQLYRAMNNNTFIMGSLTSSIAAYLSTPFDYKEVSSFFSNLRFSVTSHRLLEQSLETIKLNANWLIRNDQKLYDWTKTFLIE